MERGGAGGGEAGAEKPTGKALLCSRLEQALAKQGGLPRFGRAREDTQDTPRQGPLKRKLDEEGPETAEGAARSIWLRMTLPEDMVLQAETEEKRRVRAAAFANSAATGLEGKFQDMRRSFEQDRVANPRPALTKADRDERRAKERERDEIERGHSPMWPHRLYHNLATESDLERRWRAQPGQKLPHWPWGLEIEGVQWDADTQQYEPWPENDWAYHRGLLYGKPLDKDVSTSYPNGTYRTELHWRMEKLKGPKATRFPKAFLEAEGIQFDAASNEFKPVPCEPVVAEEVVYRSAVPGGFDEPLFGFKPEVKAEVEAEVEGKKGLSRYWGAREAEAREAEGEAEAREAEGEAEEDEGEEEEHVPDCVRMGTCLGHPKCDKAGTRFEGYCFIEARVDCMGDIGKADWSDGSDWGLSGDEEAWRAKYGSPTIHPAESEGEEEEDEGEGDPTRGCCGHRKCYLPGTRFEHCCFVAARLDHMGECDGDESPGSEWSM